MTDLLAWFGILLFLGIVGWGLVALRFKVWKERRTYGGYEPGPKSSADLDPPPRNKGAGAR
jgi:hypothetical protein